MQNKKWKAINQEAADKVLKIDAFMESHSGELALVFKRMLMKSDNYDLRDFMFELELSHNVRGFIPKSLADQIKYENFIKTEILPYYNEQSYGLFSTY